MAHNSLGESRTDLLNWLNDLLGLNFTKIEQVGTGAAHCQIIDSIYQDVPLSKVKFNSVHEYDFIANFKVLQNAFAAHGIEKVVPVEKLTKLKFQDNLEFMQWMKKYWDGHYPGGNYDAEGRRKGAVGMKKSGSSTRVATSGRTVSSGSHDAPLRKAPSNSDVGRKTGGARFTNSSHGASDEVLSNLNRQITELRTTIDGVEKERDFYFNKLRDVEILVQQKETEAPELVKEIQKILYSTEEGFEVPDAADGEAAAPVEKDAGGAAEEETF